MRWSPLHWTWLVQPPLVETTLRVRVARPQWTPGAVAGLYLAAAARSWQRAVQGIPHPHTGAMRPAITFASWGAASGRDDVVLVHLERSAGYR